jgi:hypothetical protein
VRDPEALYGWEVAMHYALVAVSQQGYRARPPTGMAIHGRRQQGMVGERERERKFERGGVAVIELCCQSYEGMWLVARKEGLAVRAREREGRSERERERERESALWQRVRASTLLRTPSERIAQ